jgi:NADP-dependent 3-hydroxy acid dehydrogenase YdfG
VASTTSHSILGDGCSTSTLWGVLYGIRAVLPHIRAYGDGGHIANTASDLGSSE